MQPLTVWITGNCSKFLKRWEYQITWPASWEICKQVRKQQLELEMEQETGSKLRKEALIWGYRMLKWETCMQVRKQQLELDMEQQTGSK